jgi:hypothetical protein
MAPEVVLFEEDFAALPIAVIGGDYSPAGEYHVSPILSSTGRWRETFIHHSFRSSTGNWQVVLENDGKKALEQTYEPKQGYPTLAAGEPYWTEVTVTVALRPMSESGWRAVIFRYRHARRFYAAVFAAGRLRVVRRDNDTETLLGEGPCPLDPDRYAAVKTVCRGAQPADLILLSAHARQGGLLDGHGRRAVMFPRDRHPTLCSDARDLDGDGVDEVLTWDHDALWIYNADVPGRGPENYPRRNPWHNDSNYRAQISLPQSGEG